MCHVSDRSVSLFQRLFSGVSVAVDGYMGSVNPVGGFQQLDVAVCTIEKANGLVNRLVREDSIGQLGRVEPLSSRQLSKSQIKMENIRGRSQLSTFTY